MGEGSRSGKGGEPVLIGQYDGVLDAKNRVFVPAKFREEMDGEGRLTLYVTRGLDGCLFLYTKAQWEAVVASVQSTPFTNAKARRFQRGFASGASECQADKQGRILIPEKLRALAGIQKKVVFVGVFTRVEMWDAEKWAATELEQTEYDEAAEGLM